MAVHTKLSEANINSIIKNYRLGDLVSFNGIQEGIENTNYLLVTEKDRFIVTIFEKRVDIENMPFYFEVMTNSHADGIECPTPIKDKDGEFVNIIKGKKMAVFIFLEGKSKNKWTKEDCFQVGKKLARFHFANKDNKYNIQNNFGLNYWKKIYTEFSSELNKILPNGFEIISNEINFISKNWPKNLPGGVIHADLFPDNVFFIKNKISGFLDFYFSCFDFLAYDLAITVNAWCFLNQEFNKDFFFNLVSGYQSIRTLEFSEIENINILLRGAALRFLFTRIFDLINNNQNNLLIQKDPVEFFKILNFHININSKDFYFE